MKGSLVPGGGGGEGGHRQQCERPDWKPRDTVWRSDGRRNSFGWRDQVTRGDDGVCVPSQKSRSVQIRDRNIVQRRC